MRQPLDPKGKPSVVVLVRLPPDLARALEVRASADGVTRSEVLRAALLAWMDSKVTKGGQRAKRT